MTWALFDVSDPVVGDIMLSYQGDMPGDVMEQIMRTRPNAVAQDFLSWLYARPGKAWLMVGGLYNPNDLNTLKDQYLSFVDRLAEDVGKYDIMYSVLSIKEGSHEGGSVEVLRMSQLSYFPGQPSAVPQMRMAPDLSKEGSHTQPWKHLCFGLEVRTEAKTRLQM